MSKFAINTETYQLIKNMPDEDVGKLFKAIYEYQIDGIEKPSPEVEMTFKIFLLFFAKDKELSMARAKAGTKGGRPKDTETEVKPKRLVSTSNQTAPIENRKDRFKSSLSPHIEKYGRDMLNAFFKYWTEPNASNTKMRFELEKTWSVDLRLSNWARNNKEIIPTSTEIKINKI